MSAELVVQKQSKCSGALCRLLSILGECLVQKAVNGLCKDKDLACNSASVVKCLYFLGFWCVFCFFLKSGSGEILFHPLIISEASMYFYIKTEKRL